MTNVTELSQDGNLRLVLALIFKACEDGDTDFLKSGRCIKLLGFIPTNMLQNALNLDIMLVTPRDLSNILVKRVESGFFKVKQPQRVVKKVSRLWKVIHPCKFEEEVHNLKEFAEDMGVSYQALLNVANEATRKSYKGYRVSKIS